MPLRVLVYLGLLYQDLIREKKLSRSGKLPPVLPVVLYNGKRRWDTSIEVSDLIEDVPGGLSRYRPRFTLMLLDEGRFRDEELKPLKNLVSALFRLENSRDPELIMQVVTSLLEWLGSPEQASLRRAFTVWFNRVFLAARRWGKKPDNFEELTEVRAMLAETVAEWQEEWKRAGLGGRPERRPERRGSEYPDQAHGTEIWSLGFETTKEDSIGRQRNPFEIGGEQILTANTLDEIFES